MNTTDEFQIIGFQDALTEKASILLAEYNRMLDDSEIDEYDTPNHPLVVIRNQILFIYKHIPSLDNANMRSLTEINGKLDFAGEILDDINDESHMRKLF